MLTCELGTELPSLGLCGSSCAHLTVLKSRNDPGAQPGASSSGCWVIADLTLGLLLGLFLRSGPQADWDSFECDKKILEKQRPRLSECKMQLFGDTKPF